MNVQVRVPGPLTEYAAGQGALTLDVPGATVGDAFSALWALHPRLRDRILDEQGNVRPHVNVFVGGESIRYTGGLATPLRAGAAVSVIPAVSGG